MSWWLAIAFTLGGSCLGFATACWMCRTMVEGAQRMLSESEKLAKHADDLR